MLLLSSLFALVAPSMAATPAVCMDLELQFQEQSRIAADAHHSVRQAEDDVRANRSFYDSRTDLLRDLESLTAERDALHAFLEATGMTPTLEASLLALAEREADVLWRISDVEHQIANMEHAVVIASIHADIAFAEAHRAESRLDRCLEDFDNIERPTLHQPTFGR